MVMYSNECCDCSAPGYPCIGKICKLRHCPHFICDECGDDVDEGELYWFEGMQLCKDCVVERLEVVKADE